MVFTIKYRAFLQIFPSSNSIRKGEKDENTMETSWKHEEKRIEKDEE